MIYEFTIATAHNTDSFLQELDNRLRWINQYGVHFVYDGIV
jgi:hypothetical protein